MVDLFWTVAIILVVLWFFGLIGGIGGEFINLLVVIAIVIVIYRLVQGRNPVTNK
jgi:hypothetical protein